MPDLTKRAYLARFLKNIDIPEEFFNDETLVEMYRQFKQMQARARVENNICKTYLHTFLHISIRCPGFLQIFSRVGQIVSNLLAHELSNQANLICV